MPIVFDPVMVATSGSVLADEATIAAFERLMRIASLVTPNVPELEALGGEDGGARAMAATCSPRAAMAEGERSWTGCSRPATAAVRELRGKRFDTARHARHRLHAGERASRPGSAGACR